MPMLKVNNRRFEKDGKTFFYLADTCWSAFTNISMNDWRHYLKKRKAQGYNVIQINVLRQWDASTISDGKVWEPFELVSNDGTRVYDYSKPNEEYFNHAEEMLKVMEEYDLTPGLILLWCNYIPDTWVHGMAQATNLMPYENVAGYVEMAVKRFKKYHPIYFISGDTDFPEESKAKDYYLTAYDVVKANDAEALVSAHIAGEHIDVYPDLLEKLDFFSYQSGHGRDGQQTSYSIPKEMLKKGFNKPMVDTEVCYEFMPKFSREMDERYSAKDVRKSSWQAVLAGAFGGVTYGAHGIWSWHNSGETFPPGYPYPADFHDALNFSGAMDIAYIKEETKDLINPQPVELDGLKALKGQNKTLVYVPAARDVDLSDLDFDFSQVKAVNLENRRIYFPEVADKLAKKLDLADDYLLILA